MFFSQSGRLLQSSVKHLQLSVRLWLLQSTTRLLQSSVRLFQSSLLFSIPFSQSVRVCQSGINQYVNLTQEKGHEWFKKIKGQSGIGSQFTSPFSIRVKRCFISIRQSYLVEPNQSDFVSYIVYQSLSVSQSDFVSKSVRLLQ